MNIELQQLRDEVIELKKRLTSQKKTIEMYQQELPHLKSEEVEVSADEMEKETLKTEFLRLLQDIPNGNYLNNCNKILEMYDNALNKQGIAPSKAVEFAEWIAKNGIKPSFSEGYWLIIDGESEFCDIKQRLETKELFNQFIKKSK